MRVPIPHSLGRDEARRRLQSRSGDIAKLVPGGMAEVTATWPSDDRMDLCVKALGKSVDGYIEVGDSAVTVVIDLPASLALFAPMVRGAVESNAQKLLK